MNLPQELKANLRRSAAQPVVEEEPENQNTINSGELSINVERYEVAKNGEIIDITLREFELLKFLAMQPDKIFLVRNCLKMYGVTNITEMFVLSMLR